MTPSTCRCGSPATAARLYPGTANQASLRLLCRHRPHDHRPHPRAFDAVTRPPHRLQSRGHPPPPNGLQPPSPGPKNPRRRPQRRHRNTHRLRQNAHLHDAHPVSHRGLPRATANGLLPRQGPGQRPTHPLATGSIRSQHGPRVPPTDHRRHANAPTGAAPSTGHRRPRNPRRGPRMAHQNSSRCSTNQVPDQPQSRCHRRGPRP